MANDSTNEDAVTEGESAPVPVELSPEEQAAVKDAMDRAAAEAARAIAEAEATRVAAEEEEKRLAEEEAARLEAERKAALVAEQTPRALKLLRQRYFRGGFGHGDIDAVLAGLETEAVVAAKEEFNAELEKLAAQAKDAPASLSPAMQPFVSESKPKRRR